MIRQFNLNHKRIFIIYIAINTICIGMGMGVPILSIILGFVVGWYLAKYVLPDQQDTPVLSRKILYYATISSGITLIEMMIIWGPSVMWLFNANADFANYGHPMILFEPKASFIAWLILMMVISPFLQLLMILFGFHVKKSRI